MTLKEFLKCLRLYDQEYECEICWDLDKDMSSNYIGKINDAPGHIADKKVERIELETNEKGDIEFYIDLEDGE